MSELSKSNALTLPSLTLEAILELTNDKEMVDLAAGLWFLTNDDTANVETPLRTMASTNYNLIKEMVVSGYKKLDGNTKKKATADNLSVMLNQSVFGRTGSMFRLAHSGFSVMVNPITGLDRTDLQYAIASNVITLHRELTGDMYSAIYITIYEAILELFIRKINFTTLDLEKKSNIKKYIKTKDLGLIIIGMLDIMFPEGYDIQTICGNKVNIGADNSTSICSNKSEPHKMRIKNLLYIADDLTDTEFEQLMNSTPGSISIADVVKYQDGFKYNSPIKFILDTNTYTIDSATVDIFIDRSKEWLKSNIVENPIYTNGSDIETLKSLINMSKIGMYFYTIAKIENDVYEATRDKIKIQHINILSTRDDVTDLFVNAAKRSLEYTYYQVGAPKYTCPTCSAKNVDKANINDVDNNDIIIGGIDDEINNTEDTAGIDSMSGGVNVGDISGNGLENTTTIDGGELPDNSKIFTNLNLLDLFSYLV